MSFNYSCMIMIIVAMGFTTSCVVMMVTMINFSTNNNYNGDGFQQ